jgi:hypothetical protein
VTRTRERWDVSPAVPAGAAAGLSAADAAADGLSSADAPGAVRSGVPCASTRFPMRLAKSTSGFPLTSS